MPSLPLFPLPAVLFPGALLPLHVFEPRYQALLADCVAGNHLFGVVPPSPSGGPPPAGAVGCVARVRAVQPLPEGRSNIVVSGEERFRLARVLPSDKPYVVGEVATLEDEPDVQVPHADHVAALRTLGERYSTALGVLSDTEREPDFSLDPALLSFQVASLLEWEPAVKQHFLAIRSATERVARLLQAIPPLLASVEARAQVHRRASRNGSGARHA
jgi:Lon protease-like protein